MWASLFGGPNNGYIVPADAGFNLLEDISHRPLSLALYIKGSYLNLPLSQIDSHSAEDLRTQQFTSFTDLQIVTALARLPEFDPQRVILRFPRELQLDDLKNANAVILGSMASNPWAAIAERNANFRIVNGAMMHGATILNTQPQPGKRPLTSAIGMNLRTKRLRSLHTFLTWEATGICYCCRDWMLLELKPLPRR